MGVLAGMGLGLPHYVVTMTAITLFFTFFVLMNAVKQALFKKKKEPPVVFHWLPFVGSALSYGQEPNKFLGGCKAKVSLRSIDDGSINVC